MGGRAAVRGGVPGGREPPRDSFDQFLTSFLPLTAGVYAWVDGRRYEGEFRANLQDGRGAPVRLTRIMCLFDLHQHFEKLYQNSTVI